MSGAIRSSVRVGSMSPSLRPFTTQHTMTVTLSPATRLNVHYAYHLIVRGAGTDPIEDQVGDAIDGANDGNVGTDYVTKITAANLVIQGSHPHVRKTLAAILAKEKRAAAKKRSS